MKYIVFEAGSRAGWSAKKFFEYYCKIYGGFFDELILVDNDETFSETKTNFTRNIKKVKQDDLFNDFPKDNVSIFSADELTRQKISNGEIKIDLTRTQVYLPSPNEYNKMWLNNLLSDLGISVPKTFNVSENIFIKPNTMSAGSKGLISLKNVCISEKINISQEYVVDCYVDRVNDVYKFYGREVKLKNGYDKYIRFIKNESDVVEFVKQIVETAKHLVLFNGVFHIQIMRDENGKLYFIEASNRISGTSIVNILRGYNPFAIINGKVCIDCKYDYQWHLYEDLLTEIVKIYE